MKFSLDNFRKNTALEAEKASLQADNTNLIAKVKELEGKLTDADKTMAALPLAKQEWEAAMEKVKSEHAAAVDALKKEHQAKLDTLTAELAATKVSVNKEVVANLAAVGIQAGEVKEETKTEAPNREQMLEKITLLRKERKNKEADSLWKDYSKLFIK